MTEQVTIEETVLFIGNLPYSYLDNEFEGLVKQYGQIAAIAVVRDERERSRGFGFVRFNNADEAKNAVDNLSGLELEGRKVRASLARSDSRYIELVALS